MPFYLEMSKNITKQRDIYDTVIFRFLQIFFIHSKIKRGNHQIPKIVRVPVNKTNPKKIK